MTWKDLTYSFLFESTASPWMQLGMVAAVLLGTAIFRKLSEGDIMSAGINISFVWMPLSMLMSLWTNSYWVYMLHWFLATLGFFVLYFFGVSVCGKYGRPYRGDGGMVMIIPIYLFPVTIVGSLFIRAIIYVFQWVIETW